MSLYKSLDHDRFLRGSVEGELTTWEPCGKIVSAERADYWEFVVGLLTLHPTTLIAIIGPISFVTCCLP